MSDLAEQFFSRDPSSRQSPRPPEFVNLPPDNGGPGEQGPQGEEGSRGYQGYQGLQGSRGAQGTQGAPGSQGATGPQGLDGPQGYQGSSPVGNAGDQGPPGFQGAPSMVQGPQGFGGPQGFRGADAEKGAMVRVSAAPVERPYARLFCSEAPEVWFFDFVHIPAGEVREAAVDPVFIEVCEPGSLFIQAVDKPFKVFLSEDQTRVYSTTNTKPLVVTLYGLRKGCGSRRFARHTAEQAAENNRFWKQQFTAA